MFLRCSCWLVVVVPADVDTDVPCVCFFYLFILISCGGACFYCWFQLSVSPSGALLKCSHVYLWVFIGFSYFFVFLLAAHPMAHRDTNKILIDQKLSISQKGTGIFKLGILK